MARVRHVLVMAVAAISAFSAFVATEILVGFEEGPLWQIALRGIPWPLQPIDAETHVAVQWMPVHEFLAPPVQCLWHEALLRGSGAASADGPYEY